MTSTPATGPHNPADTSVEGERLLRKQQLALAFRIFADLGFDEGTSGHITARDPEHPDHFWVNPYTVDFARIKVSDLLLVDGDGKVKEGAGRPNTSAFAIHSAIHDARPDVVSAAHSHSMNGRAWSSLGRLLDPITQEVCAFYEDHALFSDYEGLVLERGAGDKIAASLGGKRAVILQHHGLLTVGASVAEAAWWYIAMDRSCDIQLRAEAAGRPISISHDSAVLAHRQFGNANRAKNNFAILANRMVERQPDVLQ
jgi:ribulose-5-phosphate 4-epimerase/fuculose-1-phosphate aldolase